MTSLLIATLLLAGHANAQSCDAKKLTRQLNEAVPRATPAAWLALAECNPTTARDLASATFTPERMLPGPEAVTASVTAVELGAGPAVRAWVGALLSDERAQTLAGLGGQCADHSAMVGFFVESREELRDRFWKDRWHRGLTECRAPEVHELLRRALQDDEVQRDPSWFGSVLEVFCRNSGREAIPWMKALIVTATREDNQLHIMSAFADAASVGSTGGPDPEAAREAVTAIMEVAPQLPPKVVDQARITLQSLGAEEEANSLAGVRYAERRQADGRWLWGAVAVETAACKNGKTRIGVHYGTVLEGGQRWPDQMQAAVDDAIQHGWEMDIGQKCKGESRVEVFIPAEPFVGQDEWLAWKDAQVMEIRKRPCDRMDIIEEDTPILE